nr:17.3 kDa class I heat shock protein-like [Ipomoea batatas]
MERSSGRFLRRFRLPENVKMDGIKASMENGVLTVTVPKEEAKKTDVKAIDISDSGREAVEAETGAETAGVDVGESQKASVNVGGDKESDMEITISELDLNLLDSINRKGDPSNINQPELHAIKRIRVQSSSRKVVFIKLHPKSKVVLKIQERTLGTLLQMPSSSYSILSSLNAEKVNGSSSRVAVTAEASTRASTAVVKLSLPKKMSSSWEDVGVAVASMVLATFSMFDKPENVFLITFTGAPCFPISAIASPNSPTVEANFCRIPATLSTLDDGIFNAATVG